jgi:hypothetical protein
MSPEAAKILTDRGVITVDDKGIVRMTDTAWKLATTLDPETVKRRKLAS